MTTGMRSVENAKHRKVAPSFCRPATGRRIAIACGFLATSLIANTPVDADEFDPLAVYEEARVLNDQWQACAASFIKERLRSRQTAERLAGQALDRCRAREARLSRFLVGRVGRASASNVIALLREKYRSGLASAVTELRDRE